MNTLRYTDGMEFLDGVEYDDWHFRLGGPSPSTRTLLAVADEERHVTRLSVGNWVWQTRDLASRSGMRQVETRRGRVTELRECRDGEYVALVDFGTSLARVDARHIAIEVATETGAWTTDCPNPMNYNDRRTTRWIDVRARSDIPDPNHVSNLSFKKIDGRGSRKTVNAFLEGYEDGHVDHTCGGVHHWKAAFVALYEGHIIGAIVLAPPQNGVLAAEREEIVISRIACHPVRPENASTWLISHARNWVERSGYSRISALAGVGGNRGTCYEAAGFDLDTEEADYIDSSGNQWHRRRYVDELNPEQYADRDVPLPGEDYTLATGGA
jgi:hypothetical protein